MSVTTEQKLLEFAKWYEYNKKGIVDVNKKCEFLQKAVDNMALLMIHYSEDIKVMEGRGRIASACEIITPDNQLVKVNGR